MHVHKLINFRQDGQNKIHEIFPVFLLLVNIAKRDRKVRLPIKTKTFKTCFKSSKPNLKLRSKNNWLSGILQGKMSDKTVEESLRLVIPGDIIQEVHEVKETDDFHVILGPGLSREKSEVYSHLCGVLRRKTAPKATVFWIDCHAKRYVANRGENVIGVIIGKSGDAFRVRFDSIHYMFELDYHSS